MLIKRTERQARRGSLSAGLADQNGGGLDRRTFLRRSGIAAAAPLGATAAKADTETNDEKRKARYKETDHVKTFYRVNRYPS